jgi:cell division protein YceG involved in septum cleavage
MPEADFMPFSVPRSLRFLLASSFFAVLAAGVYGVWYVYAPVTPAKLPVEFEVPAGSSLRATARSLEKAGVLARPLHFEIYARVTGRAEEILWFRPSSKPL